MTKEQNAVQKFIESTKHTVLKEGDVWVCRTPKGNLSKYFLPNKTKVGLYDQMFTTLVEMNVIEIVPIGVPEAVAE